MYEVVCVYDRKTEKYGTPFFTDSKISALRSLGLQFLQIPLEYLSDFSVVSIGEFNPDTGLLVGNDLDTNYTYISAEEITDFIKSYFSKENKE